ncbi:major facilitator superfamily domain-containing protein [Lipomyces oligophaga]|uniref:major facilitator superfamily domain-containing protein n=1 Tax=Lipomyces oligophaga TaxID=45792 RepID=UPI0034CFC73F
MDLEYTVPEKSQLEPNDVDAEQTELLADSDSYGSIPAPTDERAKIEALIALGLPGWDPAEEAVVTKKLDVRVMIWACTMFFSLQLVRNNIQNAISADFLIDANLSLSQYNIGQSVFLAFFLLWEIPSQALVRRFGPEVWLPVLMTLWSIMSMLQVLVKGSGFFIFTRAIIGSCEGGFVPGLSFWLSSFYKSNELALRYSWVWSTQSGTNVIGALLASGFIQIGGPLRGWQWLFLLEGIICLIIGVSSFFMMPSFGRHLPDNAIVRVANTFTARESAIVRLRIALDDPSKARQHERVVMNAGTRSVGSAVRAVTSALTDKYLLPIYILGFVAFVPSQTGNYYLTITLRGLGFTQTVTNLLTIPYAVSNITMTIIFSRLADKRRQRWLFCVLAAFWMLPPLFVLEFLPDPAVGRWTRFILLTAIMGFPYYHPILVSWISANANSADRRSLAFAIYNIFVQAGNILAANVYTESDAPFYHRGNAVLIGLNVLSIIFILSIRSYYNRENKLRRAKWDALDEKQQLDYLQSTTDVGNDRINFTLST